MNTNNITPDMLAWGAFAFYVVVDISKHIITLGFKMIDKQIDKNTNKHINKDKIK